MEVGKSNETAFGKKCLKHKKKFSNLTFYHEKCKVD